MLFDFIIPSVLGKKSHHPLIINSIPKSGTHLLSSVIKNISNGNIPYILKRGVDFKDGLLISTHYSNFFNNNFEVQDFAEKKTVASFWVSQIRREIVQDLFNIPKSGFIQTHVGYSKHFSNLFKKKDINK